MVTNNVQNTTSSIILLLKYPAQHFPIEYFHLRKYAVGRSQRGYSVAHTCIQNTTIQKHTTDQSINQHQLNFNIGDTNHPTISTYRYKTTLGCFQPYFQNLVRL